MQSIDECERLNQRASELYAEGDYAGAKRLWEEVLKLSPSDLKAVEGHRMASMLSEGWSPVKSGANGGSELAQRVMEIEALLAAGSVHEAMAAAQTLRAEHGGEAEVQVTHAAALRAYEAEPFIREHLVRAREMLSAGDMEEARGCCRKVLALEEGNREAHELMREIESRLSPPQVQEAEGVSEEGARGRAGGVTLKPVASPGDSGTGAGTFSFDVEPGAPAPGLSSAPESVSGGLFEVPAGTQPVGLEIEKLDLESLDEEIERLHLAFGAPSSPLEPGGEPGAGAAQSLKAAPPAEGIQDPGLPETAPSSERPPAPWEAVEQPEDFLEEAMRSLETPGAPSGTPVLEGPGEAAASSGFGSLLAQAREMMDAGQPDAAIEIAARALAEKPDDEEASNLLERARGELDRIGREADGLMDQAHRCVDIEDLKGAEEHLCKVLEIRPDHREALSLLERVVAERRRHESRGPVAGAPPAEPPRLDVFEKDEEKLGLSLREIEPVRPVAPLPEQRRATSSVLDSAVAITAPRRFTLRRVLLVLAAVVLAVAAWLVGRALIGSRSSAPPAAVATPGSQPIRPGPARAAARPSQAAPRVAAAVPREVRPSELLSEARRALKEGSTQEAVAAIKAALAADGENEEAREMLAQASARLDREQRLQKAMDEARGAFQEGHYEEALRILYRLPEGAPKAEVEGYIFNAWFSMGVEALQSGDCRGAIEQFGEALAIRPDDRQAVAARKMAQTYRDRQKDSEYVKFANTLAGRAWDSR